MSEVRCGCCGYEYTGAVCPACGKREAKAAKAEAQKKELGGIEKCLKYCVKITCKSGDVTSSGAGFILAGGNVITNAHVVMDLAAKQLLDNITCTFDDGKTPYTLSARIVHIGYDIAVLKFSGAMAKKMAAEPGIKLSCAPVKVGQEVYTIGNPLGLGLSVSKGIVASASRATDYLELGRVIATDITVNAGNSGGPLLSEAGEAVGVLTFSNSEALGGISFGVPSERIAQVLSKL